MERILRWFFVSVVALAAPLAVSAMPASFALAAPVHVVHPDFPPFCC